MQNSMHVIAVFLAAEFAFVCAASCVGFTIKAVNDHKDDLYLIATFSGFAAVAASITALVMAWNI